MMHQWHRPIVHKKHSIYNPHPSKTRVQTIHTPQAQTHQRHRYHPPSRNPPKSPQPFTRTINNPKKITKVPLCSIPPPQPWPGQPQQKPASIITVIPQLSTVAAGRRSVGRSVSHPPSHLTHAHLTSCGILPMLVSIHSHSHSHTHLPSLPRCKITHSNPHPLTLTLTPPTKTFSPEDTRRHQRPPRHKGRFGKIHAGK